MEVAPLITSIRAITLGSMVRNPSFPLRKGVDCGKPSIIISAARPRNDCPELLMLPDCAPIPGTCKANNDCNSLLTSISCWIFSADTTVTEAGTSIMLSGIRLPVTIILSSEGVFSASSLMGALAVNVLLSLRSMIVAAVALLAIMATAMSE